ncbi:hypothetical protein QBC38DRAFT_195002 [Podospora fimiseda]|uniref:Uncharacterized protein n=1 Tax=Podospora fimiseda TaxID=252190 RepID=A0AAN6YK06_9PEZI|nr:hypothetical protein QBC38DRAFT_195002 [Podospora fimiseda]
MRKDFQVPFINGGCPFSCWDMMADNSTAGVARSQGQLCLTSFRSCLHSAAKIHPRELSLVEDQLARFSVWAANIGVFASSRASLDHRLREAPDIHNIIIDLLKSLQWRVDECHKILKALPPPYATTSSLVDPVDERVNHALEEVAKNITLLHKFYNTIRKASKLSHHQMLSISSFKIKDNKGNNINKTNLKQIFANHIRDMFPNITEKIRNRLAFTMLLRRKRILFRPSRYGSNTISISRHENPAQAVQVDDPNLVATAVRLENSKISSPVRPAAPVDVARSVVQSTAQTATTLNPEDYRRASTPSILSVTKTIPLGNHDKLRFPAPPRGAILLEYKKRLKGKEHGHSRDAETLQDKKPEGNKIWDELLNATEVICPFCFLSIPSREVMDDEKWRYVFYINML